MCILLIFHYYPNIWENKIDGNQTTNQTHIPYVTRRSPSPHVAKMFFDQPLRPENPTAMALKNFILQRNEASSRCHGVWSRQSLPWFTHIPAIFLTLPSFFGGYASRSWQRVLSYFTLELDLNKSQIVLDISDILKRKQHPLHIAWDESVEEVKAPKAVLNWAKSVAGGRTWQRAKDSMGYWTFGSLNRG